MSPLVIFNISTAFLKQSNLLENERRSPLMPWLTLYFAPSSSPVFTRFRFIPTEQKAHSTKTQLTCISSSAQLRAKPTGAPAASRWGKERWGADEELRDAKTVPTSAAATAERINRAVSGSGLLFNLFTLVTPTADYRELTWTALQYILYTHTKQLHMTF